MRSSSSSIAPQSSSVRALLIAIVCLLALALLPGVAQADDASGEAPAFTVHPLLRRTQLHQDEIHSAVLIVQVLQSDESPLEGAGVSVEAATDGTTGVKVEATFNAAASEAEDGLTNAKGLAIFDLKTFPLGDATLEAIFRLRITVTHDDEPPVHLFVEGSVSRGFAGSLFSDLVASELFVGQSYARAYGEEGENKGFDETSFTAVLRMDTLSGWYRPWALHTGLDVTLSSFPSSEETEDSQETGIAKYGDILAGSVYVIFQPGAWSRYRPTHDFESDPDKKGGQKAYDAFRWGLIGRTGLISREKKTKTGDTDIHYGRFGLYFSHHATAAASPQLDNFNVFPLRFVEISYGRYEQIFNQEDADRLVIEAGLRLAPLGNDAIPFYAGIYLNAGKGQDDLRIFAGLLLHLDELAKILR